MPRVLSGAYGGLVGLALVVLSSSAFAEEKACRPEKIIRYIDVDVSVTPSAGPADQQVTLSARCLPADSPVIIWGGQDFDAVRPVSTGTIDALGSFAADARVPADAEPGKSYYFAIMIDEQVVGTGAFQVDGPTAPEAQ